MILFQSMSSVTIWSALTVTLLIWYGTSRQPFGAAYLFLRSLATSRKYLLFFVSMSAILMLNKNELKLERHFDVSYDLTKALTGWEGSWHVGFQSFLHSDWLTAVCVFFYVVVFQSVMLASIGVYTADRNLKMYYSLCIALLLNYCVAVPFYLFVPVNEVWFAEPQVRFLMLDSFPAFEQAYRGLSGLDNCFPSLHTSISVTIALVASRSGNRRWIIFTWLNAGIIILSIFYLGIHWMTDMLAGCVLSVFAATIGLKVGAWADRTSPDPLLRRKKSKMQTSRSLGS